MADVIVAGINSDEEVRAVKGPTIMTMEERAEYLRHCKFVDEVQPSTPYLPTVELLKQFNCDFYAHGDDLALDANGNDVTTEFRKLGMFKMFKRTEGVSTTSLTAKLLDLAQKLQIEEQLGQDECPASIEEEKFDNPPQQQFLANTIRLGQFSNKKVPKQGDTIVYVSGSFDLLHHGHLKRLEEAKKFGDFMYIGLWDDDMTRYYRGSSFPIVSMQERVLMCLSCKYVDDVVIGAPFILTQDLINSLHINIVVELVGTEEDKVLKKYQNIDSNKIAREQGILREVQIDDPFYAMTVEKIAERVLMNKELFELKVAKKQKSEREYYENKAEQGFVEEKQGN